ncbi:MAG: hypothetical protein B7C24_14995, partial [Bacteroidetes bacterium 4572_77]
MKIVKYILSTLIFALSVNSLNAEMVYINKVSQELYPKLAVEFILLDDDCQLIIPDYSEIELIENSFSIPVFQYEKPEKIQSKPLHLITAINISNNNNESILEDSKNTLAHLNSVIDYSTTKQAIYSYNNQNFINQYFTNDSDLIDDANAGIEELFGASNLDSLFYAKNTGIFDVMQSIGNSEKAVLLLTNGKEMGNFENIIIYAKANNIIVNIIVFANGANSNIRRLANETNGLCFDDVESQEEANQFAAIIYNRLHVINMPTITYTSPKICNNIKNLTLNINRSSKTQGVRQEYIDNERLSLFNYPNGNLIDFGTTAIDFSLEKVIAVNNFGEPFIITGISISNPDYYQILDTFPMSIEEGGTAEIRVWHKSLGEKAGNCEFGIISDICKNTMFYATAGNDDFIPENNNFALNSPNGREKFLVGDEMDVLWAGANLYNRVVIEYSTDKGNQWNPLLDTVGVNQYLLKNVPNTPSDSCLMKISQWSKNKNLDSIITYNISSSSILGIVWMPLRNEIISAGIDQNSNGDIYSRKLLKNAGLAIVASNIPGLNSILGIPNNPKLIAYAYKSRNVILYDLDTQTFDAILTANEGDISCLSDNMIDHFIVAGTETGNVLVFDFYTKSLAASASSGYQDAIEQIVMNSDGTLFATASGKKVKIWITGTAGVISEIPSFSNKVVSINFTENPTELLISLENNRTYLWEVFQNTSLSTFSNGSSNICIASASQDTSLLAIAHKNHSMYLWDTENEKVFFDFNYHDSPVNYIKWFIDNNGTLRVASGDKQGYVKVWKVRDIPFYNNVLKEDVSNDYWSIIPKNIIINDMDFGFSPINKYVEKTGYIENLTPNQVTIDSITISNHNGIFNARIKNIEKPISEQSFASVTFSFIPNEISSYYTQYKIHSGNSQFSAILEGAGINSELEINPKQIDFGVVSLNSISRKSISITNQSAFDITIDSVDFLNNNDVYAIKNMPAEIKHGEIIEIEFKPTEEQVYNNTIRISSSANNSPNFISLQGEGNASILQIEKEHHFPDKLCQETIVDSLLLLNVADFVLEIDSTKIIGKDAAVFHTLQEMPYSINSGDDKYFLIQFDGEEIGDYQTELIIYANDSLEYSIALIAHVDAYKIRFSKEEILFSLTPDETAIDSILITNIGSIPFNFNPPYILDYFQITADKNQLLPKENMKARIEFMGVNHDTTIIDTLYFLDGCNQQVPMAIMAMVGSNIAVLEAPVEVDFGNIYCDEIIADTLIEIKNLGDTELLISSVELKNAIAFEVLNYPTSIAPDESEYIHINYLANINGSIIDSLKIISNASNIEGNNSIAITANLFSNAFSVSLNTILFTSLNTGEPADSVFTIYNEGDYNNTYYFSPLENYELTNVEDNSISINTGESQNIYVQFKGGIANTNYLEELIISDSCHKVESIFFDAEINDEPEVRFSIPDLAAYPYDTLKIPIYIYSIKNQDLPEADSYKFTISMNPTLLFDYADEYIDTVINTRRYIYLEIPAGMQTSDKLLEELSLIVAVGNSNKSEIRIDSVEILGGNFQYETQDGQFTLLRRCPYGGLIDDTGILKLSQNTPNPTTAVTEIS